MFAGAGGLGLGTCLAGFEPAAVVEWDRNCCDTIRENQTKGFEPLLHWPLTEGDVRSFDFRSFEDRIELITGGPPCQPWSQGGKHQSHADDRNLFPEAVRAVRVIRPAAFLFENVRGLTRAAFRNFFEYIRLQLTYPEIPPRGEEDWTDHLMRLERHHTSNSGWGLRYNVIAEVLNAADFGVPQRRERVFIVGFRADLGIEWNFPAPTHSLDALLWDQHSSGEYWEQHEIGESQRIPVELPKPLRFAERPNQLPWRTVRDGLHGLPDPEFEADSSSEYLNHRFQPGARSYTGHTGSPFDSPAKTLKAGVHGVPGGENTLLKTDGTVRYFTPREAARLQTFPDEFAFRGSWTETMRQIGNAVPVLLAEELALEIHERLDPPLE